jgi:hypothetical protein
LQDHDVEAGEYRSLDAQRRIYGENYMKLSRRGFLGKLLKGLVVVAITPIITVVPKSITANSVPSARDVVKNDVFVPEIWNKKLQSEFYKEAILTKLL